MLFRVSSAIALQLPPRRPGGLVPRARLIRRLAEARDVPVVVVVAPAGYGKTTVLSEWAEQDPRPFAWIRLDAAHDDADTLIASVGDALGAAGQAATPADLAACVAAAPDPFVLVLDDVDALRPSDAFEVLQAIAEAMPPGSQLALAARREPALAVGRLRAHRRVVELRRAELAMGRSEAAALLHAAGLRLHGDQLDALVSRTEGWPAGLYLAALSLRAQPDVRAALEHFAGDDCVVADYLRDELLASVREDQFAFLVRTSVLDTLSAPVCDAVLDLAGSGATLAGLARSGTLLVSLDRNGESYRHHALFADMLRAELRRSEPDLEPVLHRRASLWYASRGETHAAIRHAVAAGDVHVAGDLLWAYAADRIAHGGNDDVRRWLDEFTAEEIATCTPLALVAASSSLVDGDCEQAERWTAAAAQSLEGTTGETPPSLAAALTILQASVCRGGIARMGADAARAGQSQPEQSVWRATGRLLEGVALHLTGRRDAARVPLEEGGRGGAAVAPSIQALCLAQLALLVAEDEDWDQAAVIISRARRQVNASGLDRYPAMSLVFAVSGLVRAQRGMVDEARGDLLSCTRLLGEPGDFVAWYEAETRLTMARVALRLGDVTAARTLLAEASHALREASDSTALRAWLEQTRLQLDAATRSAGEVWALTTAELRVLQLLPTHLSYPAIAQRLYVSPNTVKTHVRAVYRKLDASSRGEAVAHAFAAGLLDDAQAA
jgi:LuxR family transcriptional regulator, maltose regulon positive regulatory protein